MLTGGSGAGTRTSATTIGYEAPQVISVAATASGVRRIMGERL